MFMYKKFGIHHLPHKLLLHSFNRRGADCTHRGNTFTRQGTTMSHWAAITNIGLALGHLFELFVNLSDFHQKNITHEWIYISFY